MKKYLLIIGVVLMVIGLPSCSPYQSKQVHNVPDIHQSYNINKFEYEGHKYIHFCIRASYGNSGIVHDPNCKCHVNTER